MNMEPMEIPAKVVNGMRITVGALVVGIVSFAVIVIGLRTQIPAFAPEMTIIAYIGVAMLTLMVGLQFVVLPMTDASARKRIDPQSNDVAPWLAAWGGRTITGCALLEGAAFMCLIGALLDGQPLGLIGGLAGAALMIVFHWPTVNKLREYAERQRERATMERNG